MIAVRLFVLVLVLFGCGARKVPPGLPPPEYEPPVVPTFSAPEPAGPVEAPEPPVEERGAGGNAGASGAPLDSGGVPGAGGSGGRGGSGGAGGAAGSGVSAGVGGGP
ncbi:MAG TPA: hypothetical protein VKY73_18655 [Polyangiaceae bacterium]|nr:hypothetical protein [Polyangiaceae bacterium]